MESEITFGLVHQIPTDFLCKELWSAFYRVWDTSVGFSIAPCNLRDVPIQTFPWYGAVAWSGGSWTGNVRVGFSRELACSVASKMLGVESLLPDQTEDVLREVSNMIAGNLKSALPGRCGLATPGNFSIRSPTEVDDEFHPIVTNWYNCGENYFFVALSALEPDKNW